jgi:hypothetical protein
MIAAAYARSTDLRLLHQASVLAANGMGPYHAPRVDEVQGYCDQVPAPTSICQEAR